MLFLAGANGMQGVATIRWMPASDKRPRSCQATVPAPHHDAALSFSSSAAPCESGATPPKP